MTNTIWKMLVIDPAQVKVTQNPGGTDLAGRAGPRLVDRSSTL